MLAAARAMRWIAGIGACGACCLTVVGPAGAALPDGRVYEQVTPVDKNGADVLPDQSRAAAAVGGSAVAFASLEGFGDVQGFGVATDYVSRRGSDGTWTTSGITPPQEPSDIGLIINSGFESRYLLFSDDLSHGVFLARSPLTDAPNVASVINMYTRDDVLKGGPGSYELLTGASSAQTPTYPLPWVADASEDFSHVIFESRRNLTPETMGLDAEQPKLYEWVEGTVRLAGVLPDGGPTLSRAGQGVLNKRPMEGMISRDGRRIVFTAPTFSDDLAGGVLYVRDNQGTSSVLDDESVRVSASERTDCNDDLSCGGDDIPDATPDPANPGGAAPPAMFWAATADGALIFFTSSEQLTDDDINHARDLYRFDLNAAPGDRLTRLSVDEELSDNSGTDLHNGHDVSGVLGTSQDGSYVYFTVTQGQLVSGGPTGATGGPGSPERIFRWHEDALREVGAVNGGGSVELPRILGSEGLTPKWSRVTPDGKHLVFLTQGSHELLSLYGKPDYDHGTSCPSLTAAECLEVYVYDAVANSGAGNLQCASCNPTGQAAVADADFYGGTLERGGAAGTLYLNRIITDDGRYVFFNSAERLSPHDENSAIDAYEFDTVAGQVHLISSGRGSGDQLYMDASADGRDVFFISRERLRSSDQDQSRDMYDARVGGLPDPGIAPVVPCAGEACRSVPRNRGILGAAAPTVGADGARDRLEKPGARAAFSVQPLSARQRQSLVRRGKARVVVLASRGGRVNVALTARIGGRTHTIDRASGRSAHAGPVQVLVRLNAAARRALARQGHLRMSVATTYSQSSAVHAVRFTLKRGRS